MDLGAVMPATEFRVTDKEGAYLCVAWGLIFEGSILAYNPARDEAEWVPACGVTNDLSKRGMNMRRQKNGKRRTPPTWKSKGRRG